MTQQKQVLHHKGFTVPEVILVSAVIAVIAVMSISNLTAFLDGKQEKEERAQMAELERSIDSYIKRELQVPASYSTMGAEFAKTGNLSAGQIVKDTWGRPRAYVARTLSIPFKYTTIDVNELYVLSLGADGCVGGSSTCYIESPDNTATVLSAVASTYPISNFDNLSPIEDDLLIKVSDVQEKKELYYKSVERLDRLSSALSRYAEVSYYEDVAKGVADANDRIYFPPSDSVETTVFGSSVLTDTNNVLAALGSSASVISNDDSDLVKRLEGMIALTRILGLPASSCCNAMKKVSISGEMHEEPFYYYAFPLVKKVATPTIRSSHCELQPISASAKLAMRKFGARISIEADVCGK